MNEADLLNTDVDAVLHELGVASGLNDVDFSGRGPLSVDVLSRKHPDGRPQPVAQRHLGPHLHLAVDEVERVDRSESGVRV